MTFAGWTVTLALAASAHPSAAGFILGTEQQAAAVAIADVDGDGFSDVVVAGYLTDRLLLYRGPVDPTSVAVEMQGGAAPKALAVADLDGDGRQDVVAGSGTQGVLTVHLGAARGAPLVVATASPIVQLAAGRLDDDDIDDLLVVTEDRAVWLVLGDPTGRFLEQRAYASGVDLVRLTADRRVVEVDLDRQLLTLTDLQGASSTLPTVEGPAAVALLGRRLLVAESISDALLEFDLDAAVPVPTRLRGLPGRPTDIAVGPGGSPVAIACAGARTVLMIDSLAGELLVPTRSEPQAIAIGDVTADGELDLIVLETNVGGAAVHSGRKSSPPPLTRHPLAPSLTSFAAIGRAGRIVAVNAFDHRLHHLDLDGNVFELEGGAGLRTSTIAGLNDRTGSGLVAAAGGRVRLWRASPQGLCEIAATPYRSQVRAIATLGTPTTNAGIAVVGSTGLSWHELIGADDFAPALDHPLPAPANWLLAAGTELWTGANDWVARFAVGEHGPRLLSAHRCAIGAQPPLITDLDRDGWFELLAIGPGRDLLIYPGSEHGLRNAIVFADIAGHPEFVLAHDVDGDGLVDLVVGDAVQSSLAVWGGQGGLAFERRGAVATGGRPFAGAVSDIDDDGRPELLVLHRTPGEMSVLRIPWTMAAP